MQRGQIHAERGSALVELAVSLPLLVLLLVGTVDFARVFYTAIELTNAARAGAQYGAASLANSAQDTAMETTATSSVNISGVSADASRLCQCADASGTWPFSATTPPNNCTSPPADACPTAGYHRVLTVTVTTQAAFSMISPLLGSIIPSPLQRSATLRVTE